jgi:hypothetical protein
VKVDVAIEFLRDREDARDVTVRVAVGIRAPAYKVGALPARFDQEFFRAGVVEQSLLRKHANLEINRPRVVALQSPDRMEAPKPHARVDLHMRAHAHGALQDRLFQRAASALVNVLLSEGALCRCHRSDRFRERSVA